MKEEPLEMEGIVTRAHRGHRFDVVTDTGHRVFASLCGRMVAKRKVYVTVGDRVKIEISPYDLRRGRIVYRL